MKRSGPIKRKTPMRRAPIRWPSPERQQQLRAALRASVDREYHKPRKQLRPVSKKLAAANSGYEAAKRKWRAGHDGRCEMRFFLINHNDLVQVERGTEGDDIHRCHRRADNNPHHMAGRGPNLARVETFLAVCRTCHTWIHDHPNEARRLGYLIRSEMP